LHSASDLPLQHFVAFAFSSLAQHAFASALTSALTSVVAFAVFETGFVCAFKAPKDTKIAISDKMAILFFFFGLFLKLNLIDVI